MTNVQTVTQESPTCCSCSFCGGVWTPDQTFFASEYGTLRYCDDSRCQLAYTDLRESYADAAYGNLDDEMDCPTDYVFEPCESTPLGA